ncbi:hypothetical protein EBU94_06720 [bacterium]|nr:hypothetical protein [bacterium]
MSTFNASILLNESLNTLITNLAMDLAVRSVMECSKKYNFDGEEAVRELGLNSSQLQIETTQSEENSGLPPVMSVRRKTTPNTVILKKSKVTTSKPAFPLPYNGVINDDTCLGLKNNHGLYTQCELKKITNSDFCKTCAGQSSKNSNGKPDYGTVWERGQVGIMDYRDPNGKGPIHYTKIMKKMGLTQEAVIQEAERFDITIDPIHFVAPEPTKPVSGKKGRPQKPEKVIEVDECNNLFASLTLNTVEPADIREETKQEFEPAPLKVEKKEKATKISKVSKTEDAKLEKARKAEEVKAEKARKIEEAKAEKARKAEEAKAEKARLKGDDKKKKTTKVDLPIEIPPEEKPQQTTSSSIVEPNNLVKFDYDGEVYFKTPDNLLYDNNRQLVAKINANNDVIFLGLNDADSDEESEDSYEEED